ncbi:MAG: hypothetical protein AAB875_06050 [Patescibacteria group bacterium]
MENQTVPIAPTPEPVPTPQKPKNFLLIGMVALVLILIASTGYLAFQNYQLRKQISQLQISPVPTSTATPDPTANWKTYINSEYKYSIKYPPDWQEKPRCYGGRQEDNYVCILSPDFEESPGQSPVQQGGLISIGSVDESLGFGQTLSEFCASTVVDKVQNCEEIMIGTLNGIQRSFVYYDFTDVGILEGGKIIFTFRAYYTPDSKDKTLDSFNQILSTFKFLETPSLTP